MKGKDREKKMNRQKFLERDYGNIDRDGRGKRQRTVRRDTEGERVGVRDRERRLSERDTEKGKEKREPATGQKERTHERHIHLKVSVGLLTISNINLYPKVSVGLLILSLREIFILKFLSASSTSLR